jgi:hypothetical protein
MRPFSLFITPPFSAPVSVIQFSGQTVSICILELVSMYFLLDAGSWASTVFVHCTSILSQ